MSHVKFDKHKNSKISAIFLIFAIAFIGTPAVGQLIFILYAAVDLITYNGYEPLAEWNYQEFTSTLAFFLFEVAIYIIIFLFAHFKLRSSPGWHFYGWTFVVASVIVLFISITFLFFILPLFYFLAGGPFGISRF